MQPVHTLHHSCPLYSTRRNFIGSVFRGQFLLSFCQFIVRYSGKMTITVQSRNESREMMIETKKRKSNAGRWIGGTMVVFLALSITFIVLYVQELTKDPNEGKEDRSIKVCLTPQCVAAAGTLVAHMNRDAPPCDDFYEFACGNWNKTSPMPGDKARYSTFDILRVQLVQNLKQSLTKTERAYNNPMNTTDKLQEYYSLCSTASADNDAKAWDVLRRELAAFNMSMENWPFSDATSSNTIDFSPENLVHVLSRARRQGNMLGVFNTYIMGNPQSTDKNVISFDVPHFALQRNYYLNETDKDMIAARAAYRRYGKELASLIDNKLHNSTSTAEDFDKIFDDILAFEATLMNATLPREETLNETRLYNPKILSAFNYTSSINFTSANWVSYFQRVYPQARDQINADMTVNIRQERYYQALHEALTSKLNNPEAGLRFFANYIGFKIIESYLKVLPSEAQAISARFQNAISGTTAQPPKWETCVDLVNAQLPNAVGSLYVQKYFRPEAKTELEEMITNILDSFKKIIRESYWMDEETRTKAMAKAEKFTPLVAYEDYLMNNNTEVNNEHSSFQIVKDDLLGTYLNAQNFVVDVEGKKLVRDNKPSDWITGAAIVNAFYMPDYNSISFPAGILQPPFLGYGYPKFWNYAAIGTVIGHEITHGFDNQGSQVDGDGKLIDWWTAEARAAFDKRASDIIIQYNTYTYLGSQLNGNGTQGENIADNGGIKESFMAYLTYVNKTREGKPEDRLPGFHTFTSEQMFYLSYAQLWCSDYTPQEMKKQLSRPHSPGRYRIIGPLQNSLSFAQAYKCPQSTYMNPKDKFAVW